MGAGEHNEWVRQHGGGFIVARDFWREKRIDVAADTEEEGANNTRH